MMTKMRSTVALLGAALLLTPTSAHAFDMGNALVACFGGDTDSGTEIMDEAMTECELAAGAKQACAVISGQPWACAAPQASPQGDEICYDDANEVRITAEITTPVNWKIKGTGTVKWDVTYLLKDRISCLTTPIIPIPTAPGGTYASESATAVALVSMSVKGDFTLTSPVGLEVSIGAGMSCNFMKTKKGHKEDTVSACAAPTTCTVTTPSGTTQTQQCTDPDATTGDPSPPMTEPPTADLPPGDAPPVGDTSLDQPTEPGGGIDPGRR